MQGYFSIFINDYLMCKIYFLIFAIHFSIFINSYEKL